MLADSYFCLPILRFSSFLLSASDTPLLWCKSHSGVYQSALERARLIYEVDISYQSCWLLSKTICPLMFYQETGQPVMFRRPIRQLFRLGICICITRSTWRVLHHVGAEWPLSPRVRQSLNWSPSLTASCSTLPARRSYTQKKYFFYSVMDLKSFEVW